MDQTIAQAAMDSGISTEVLVVVGGALASGIVGIAMLLAKGLVSIAKRAVGRTPRPYDNDATDPGDP